MATAVSKGENQRKKEEAEHAHHSLSGRTSINDSNLPPHASWRCAGDIGGWGGGGYTANLPACAVGQEGRSGGAQGHQIRYVKSRPTVQSTGLAAEHRF